MFSFVPRRLRVIVVVVGAVVALFADRSPATAQGGNVPSGLRSTFLMGLAAHPSNGQTGQWFENINWLRNSGTRWDACYQYLVGGVNTGNGWATWNPGGAFATDYLNEADAAGYIPVFTYYQMLQSNPHAGSGESAQDYNNLNNSSTMASYYADFKLLMQKCGAFGKRVIVHVEPDMWAYLQNYWAGGSDNAASVSAAVASSGFAEAAGLPNTAAGYAQCLVKLRNTYAPNVLLAPHASSWATNVDLSVDSRATIDVAAHARKVANFLNSLGTGWDLFFTDPCDRDAGFYEFVYGDSSHWWNESDNPTTFPSFVRMRQWVGYLSEYQNKRCVVWQIPVGNYFYATCNNTWGHYEDNRAQYFLEGYPTNQHIKQWADAGVIGLLFGKGADGPASYADSMGDNITNPPRFVPASGKKAPANLGNVSQYPDDDGGYLRLKVRAYFAAGALSLPGGGTAPPPPPPPAASFTLALSPTSQSIGRSRSGTFTVSLAAQNGFASPVKLSATVSPSLSGSLALGTTSVTPPGSTPLTVNVGRNATRRTYTVTVTGTGGGLTRTATATVTVP